MRRALAFCLAFISIATQVASEPQGDPLPLRYGVAAFGSVNPVRSIDTIAAAGFDYIEPALSQLVALDPDALASARATIAASRIHVETMNWFLPGTDIKLTGPQVDRAQIRAYLEKSLALAESFGAKVIVFGSPGARSVPDGFPHDKAWEQLKDFLRMCGEVIQAHDYGMVIGIEALRKPESNIVNSVAEALKLAREVNHPKIRIIVDFYHLTFEHENPDVILGGRDMIVHLQIADPRERTFPVSDTGEPRYRQFFTNLRKIGYHGRISVEANSDNVEADAKPSLAFLKKMAAAAAD
jgi:sugar phosphate isomerase/epimerase